AELLVLVNAESLPTDPATDTAPDPVDDPVPDTVPDQGDQDDQDDDANHPEDPTETDADNGDTSTTDTDSGDIEDTENPEHDTRPATQETEATADADNVLGAEGGRNARKAGETGCVEDTGDVRDGHGSRDGRDRQDTDAPGDVDDAADADDGSGADDACGVDVVDAAGRGDDLCDRTETTEAAEPGPAVSESAASELIKPVESVGPAEAVEPALGAPGEAEGTDAVAPGAGAGLGDAAGCGQAKSNKPESKQPEGTRSEKARSSEPQQSKPRQSEPQYSESQQSESRSGRSRWDEWQPPAPPSGDSSACHAHAGPRPAGGSRHGLGTPEYHRDERAAGPGPGLDPGPGAGPGQGAGADPGSGLGALLGRAPGLLLATGQVLPVSGVHRLARTSALVRLVMNADGQVLDMGRKVRLATPAQRRAVFARYATCWIDGCPLPATMCQIDHADNWSTGGLTDLKLLGPACQFHNRDRYQHPERYTRHTTGKDRWTFTYHHPTRARKVRA
ncbi:hypothetical protein AB0O28_32660, partial [Microbispora sp. NPDC088329]